MIVYVESNFVLELAYKQEAHSNCEELLKNAEAGRLTIVLPAFCITECRMAWRARAKKRTELHDQLRVEIRELGRSLPHADIPQKSKELVLALAVESREAERRELEETFARMLSCNHVEVASMDERTTEVAIEFERIFDLTPQDAVVLATVVQHLESSTEGPKFFLTKNSKDFLHPDVIERLAQHECTLSTDFRSAEREIARILAGGGKQGA